MNNPINVYDLVIKFDAISRKDLEEWIRALCKHWVYQKESGEKTGYVHWQMRVSLSKKARFDTMLGRCNATFGKGFGKLMRTHKDNAELLATHGLAFYCMKDDTRLEGPWTDKDKKARYVQKRFRNAELSEWQERLLKKVETHMRLADDRHIILVVDEDGNNGKSFFKGYQYSHSDAVMLPSCLGSTNDAIQLLCANKAIPEGWHGVIMMDVPRATSARHWFTMSQGLESIKQGFLHDIRYSSTEKIIEPPVMVVFCNKEPPEGCMSSDVFQRFKINLEEPRLAASV